jgi:hypothetical protein
MVIPGFGWIKKKANGLDLTSILAIIGLGRFMWL